MGSMAQQAVVVNGRALRTACNATPDRRSLAWKDPLSPPRKDGGRSAELRFTPNGGAFDSERPHNRVMRELRLYHSSQGSWSRLDALAGAARCVGSAGTRTGVKDHSEPRRRRRSDRPAVRPVRSALHGWRYPKGFQPAAPAVAGREALVAARTAPIHPCRRPRRSGPRRTPAILPSAFVIPDVACHVRSRIFCWSWACPCALSRWKAVARSCLSGNLPGVEAACRAGALRSAV